MSVRGLFTFKNALHTVIDGNLVRVDGDGARTTLAALGSTAGIVDMDASVTQLAITDGSLLYLWDGANLTTSTTYAPGDRITWIDQRLVAVERSSQRFRYSNLLEGGTFEGLSFFSAEAAPDNVVACLSDHSDLWLLGEDGTEIWQSVGGEDVFARYQGSYVEYGCAATHSAQKLGSGSIMWLGRSKNGQAQVVRSQGHSAKRVSTRAIEERFQGVVLSPSFAYTYSDGGSEFYCLNVPGADTTLVYDATYGEWHERAEWVDGAYQKWRPTCHAFAYGQHFFGTESGEIFRLDPNVHTYGTDPKVRSRISPIIGQAGRGRMVFGDMHIVCERATSGTVMLRFKDDPQAGWSNWQRIPTGEIGHYTQEITARRLGSAKTSNGRVFEMRFTDDAPFNPVQAKVQINGNS